MSSDSKDAEPGMAHGIRDLKKVKNFSVLHKSLSQAERSGVISLIMGSIEKPFMSQRNCSGDMERSSSEDLGQQK